jgi:copper transport protein
MRNRPTYLAAGSRGVCLLAVLTAALVAAPAAAAHATLVSSTPANDEVVARPPSSVALRFSEPVESAFGAVRIYDSDAKRVDSGRVARPDGNTVDAAIDQPLGRGTYTVTWRVVSADSHPVSGAFVFHVGAPGANPAGVASQVERQGAPRSVRVLFTIVRFFDFALILLVAGGAVALAYPLRSARPALRRRLLLALGGWAGLLALTALAGIVLQGATARGLGVSEAAGWHNVTEVLDTRFGNVWLVQALVAAAVALLAFAATDNPSGLTAAVLVAPALTLAATPALSGHASVNSDLSLVADIAHVAAAAVWTGGLAFVVIALVGAAQERWSLAARAVPRFSLLAVVSVGVLLVAGIVNGYEEVGAWRGLWDTTYGLLLLAKIALVLPLLALGFYNNRYAVPRLRSGIASVVEQRRFLRMVGVELAIVLGVVGVTAVLVTEPPAKAAVAAPQGPYTTTVALGALEAKVVVDPAKPGANLIHVYLTDSSGRPASVAELKLAASLPNAKVGPLRYRTHPAALGDYAVHRAQLGLAGDWELRIEARRGEFEALTGTVSVPIREGD